MKKIKCLLLIIVLVVASVSVYQPAYSKANYTVNKKALKKMAKKTYHSHANKYTSDYLGLNSYLEKMRKKGGGTLTIKKGTYKICNAICVPSNITIIFKSGVKFVKTSKTGIKGQKAASGMWQIVPKKKSLKKNSVKGYNGSKNVKFIAQGKVTFDMKKKYGMCVACAHNDGVEISGITFKGMNGDHYIEVNGSKNVNIHNNYFGAAVSKTKKKNYNKEAINVDTPDAKTHGIPLKWVKKDITPCQNVTIQNNTFYGITRGVGTHKYSQKGGKHVYHKNVKVIGNKFYNIYDNGVFVLNWQGATINNNVFNNIGKTSNLSYSSGSHGISGGGIQGITIKGNSFTSIKRNPIYFGVQKNVKAGSSYKKTVISITAAQYRTMVENKAAKCGNEQNKKYKGYHFVIFKGNGERVEKNVVAGKFGVKSIYCGDGTQIVWPVEPTTTVAPTQEPTQQPTRPTPNEETINSLFDPQSGGSVDN
ncbi:MAG: hypothetical protein IJ889_03965 [Eubacterium sp.]|nr:hypothetical protein [Eubacterium sp.]